MHRFMLLLGLGAALLAAWACAQRPDTPLTQAAARNDVAALPQPGERTGGRRPDAPSVVPVAESDRTLNEPSLDDTSHYSRIRHL